MMLILADVRAWIASIGNLPDKSVYIGKLDNSKQKVVGVYGRPSSGAPYVALGGLSCTTYAARKFSILIHWNRSKPESEAAAFQLYEKLLHESEHRGLLIGNVRVQWINIEMPEPKDIGPTEDGIYEYVIWFTVNYERMK